MSSSIFQFLLNFAEVMGAMAANLWAALDTEILGVPIWALLGSSLIVGALLVNIIRAIVGAN